MKTTTQSAAELLLSEGWTNEDWAQLTPRLRALVLRLASKVVPQ